MAEQIDTSESQQVVALVLHYKDPAVTFCCLKSLRNDNINNVFIVDNSEDGGISALELIELSRSALSGSTIYLATPKINLGFSAGVNYGLQAIGINFGTCQVLLINNDARMEVGCSGKLQRRMANDKSLLVVGANINEIHGSGGVAYYQRTFGLITKRPMAGSFMYLSGCCMLLSSTLAALPLFDERFFFYGEDIELAWRLKRVGLKFDMVPDAFVSHYGSASSRNGSYFYEYSTVRAHCLLTKKLSRNKYDFAALTLGRCLMIPCRAAIRSLRRRNFVPMRAALQAVIDLNRRDKNVFSSISPDAKVVS